MTWRQITAAELNKFKNPLIIDVRSACEHCEEHIIDSVNVPLLSNEERSEVGIIYARQGELVARRHALRIIAPKIPEMIERIVQLRKQGQSVVVHCWRGGLRSEAVASMLSVVGIDCFRLMGGYKAWRKQVLADFVENSYKFVPVVLHGLTGVGKTAVLCELASGGKSVLDLESIANHRGSVFGGMGLGAQPTQKNFDAMLWQNLRSFGDGPVFLEGESRKVGKISLPDCVFDRISRGKAVLVTGSLEARAKRIIADYAGVLESSVREEALNSLEGLKGHLGTSRVAEVREKFLTRDLKGAVEILLIEYYDPLYNRQIKRALPFELEVCGDDPQEAARRISDWADRAFGKQRLPEKVNHRL